MIIKSQTCTKAICAILREAIRHNGTTFDWIYPGGAMQERLRVYGRTGQPCHRCQTPIEYLRVAQRGTTHLPHVVSGNPTSALLHLD